jgi:hypothetical protein
MSPEDVWPRWLSKFLKKEFSVHHFAGGRETLGVLSREPLAQRLKLDAPVVCRQCNNEWMSQIETLVKPILIPLITNAARPCELSTEACLTISAWAMVKAVVLDRFSLRSINETTPFFSPQQRETLRIEHMPSGRISIWLARLVKQPKRPSGQAIFLRYPKFPYKDLKHARLLVVTVSMNELVIQLRAIKSIKSGKRAPHTIPFGITPDLGTWPDYTVEIWPDVPDPLFWPPGIQLGGSGLENFAYRFGGPPPSPLL